MMGLPSSKHWHSKDCCGGGPGDWAVAQGQPQILQLQLSGGKTDGHVLINAEMVSLVLLCGCSPQLVSGKTCSSSLGLGAGEQKQTQLWRPVSAASFTSLLPWWGLTLQGLWGGGSHNIAPFSDSGRSRSFSWWVSNVWLWSAHLCPYGGRHRG